MGALTARTVSRCAVAAVAAVAAVSLAGCAGQAAPTRDGTEALDAFARDAVGHATQTEVSVAALPGAPDSAHLVIACPYAPLDTVADHVQGISPAAQVDSGALPSDSEGSSTWLWVTPEQGVVETWTVGAHVNPCPGAAPVLAAAPDDTVRITTAGEGWAIARGP